MTAERPDPLPGQRQERLLRALRATGSVVVSTLAPELGVSEMTLRRDLNALAARGLAVRVHGGATLPDAPGQEGVGPGSEAPQLTIGLVLPGVEYYWSPVVVGAREAAARVNARLILRCTGYDPIEDRKQVQSLLSYANVDGLIMAPTLDSLENGELVTWLDSLPVPVVLADRRSTAVPVRNLEWVTSDHAAGGALAVQHLVAQGHRRIAVCSGPTATTDQLLGGWHRESIRLGLDPAEQFAMRTDLTERDRRHAADELLERCTSTGTTAVIVHPDILTLTLVQQCLDAGIAIPDDLAVVSYDDEVAALADPPLSAVMPLKQDVGRMAMEMVHARLMAGDRRPPNRLTVMPVLNVRRSSTTRRG
ncbi:substrate-binding domain-containing protein [Ruania zhangjianzhongii]|uniref:substrate-binding domain-containing protein n=1 Tax=Ruania zhangjianzhongii TaxID=2603206 RepID=UPI0011C8E9D9|nr:substrate-binding domain-containing protein [Ruania zhangjianzhongii]